MWAMCTIQPKFVLINTIKLNCPANAAAYRNDVDVGHAVRCLLAI